MTDHNPFGDFINDLNLDGMPEPDTPADMAADAAAMFMGRRLTEDEANRLADHVEHGSEEDFIFNGLRSDEEVNAPEGYTMPDPSDINDAITEFLDSLPNPNETNLWEGKLTDLGLRASGYLVHEIYSNFIDGHFPEWMPVAEDFASMEEYLYAKQQAVSKIKYMIGFCARLQSLVEAELRRHYGDV